MRFWISRGVSPESEDDVFFESKKPREDGRKLPWVCYLEFLEFTGIRLKRGESIEMRTGKRFMWKAGGRTSKK